MSNETMTARRTSRGEILANPGGAAHHGARMNPKLPTLLAPLLALVALASVRPAVAADTGRVALWNGKDIAGWSVFLGDATVDRQSVWRVSDGVLHLATKASGYLKTEKTYANYHLHVEWRWPKDAPVNTNSGVLVHLNGEDKVWPACFECQLKHGNAGQVVGMGLDIPAAPMDNNRKRAPKFAASSEKPLNEWNTYEIYCRGDTIEVFINGVRQNSVEKLPVGAGNVALQMEGFPIDFRNVWLEPL